MLLLLQYLLFQYNRINQSIPFYSSSSSNHFYCIRLSNIEAKRHKAHKNLSWLLELYSGVVHYVGDRFQVLKFCIFFFFNRTIRLPQLQFSVGAKKPLPSDYLYFFLCSCLSAVHPKADLPEGDCFG